MKFQRTAGPLGRAFGFTMDAGRLHFAFNAGWYALVLNWRGLGYIHVTRPFQVSWYRAGAGDIGGSWPYRSWDGTRDVVEWHRG